MIFIGNLTFVICEIVIWFWWQIAAVRMDVNHKMKKSNMKCLSDSISGTYKTQCGNFRILLSRSFYKNSVKSTLYFVMNHSVNYVISRNIFFFEWVYFWFFHTVYKQAKFSFYSQTPKISISKFGACVSQIKPLWKIKFWENWRPQTSSNLDFSQFQKVKISHLKSFDNQKFCFWWF